MEPPASDTLLLRCGAFGWTVEERFLEVVPVGPRFRVTPSPEATPSAASFTRMLDLVESRA